jgi:hypothetical protein
MGRSDDLYIKAGSFDPMVWLVKNPDTGLPEDLTVSGFSVSGVVASHNDGTGVTLLELEDADVWRRTATGQIFFQPPSAMSTSWPAVSAYYQAELTHPSGEVVRFASGRYVIDTDLSSED